MKRHCLILAFLSATVTILTAQPLCQINSFTVNNGLSQGTVVSIQQDKKGYIWLGTWNGLNRFDGYTFKHYKAFPGDGCTLTTNRLIQTVLNSSGDIWCKNYDNKLYLFDTSAEKFIEIQLPVDPSFQQGNTVA